MRETGDLAGATQGRGSGLSIAGAVLTALAASACCLGPSLLVVLGVGGAGAVAAFGAYRPYLLGATGLLLGAGFYLTYRRPREVRAGGCDCARPRARRAGRIALWLSTAAVVRIAASPPLLARWSEAGRGSSPANDPTLAHATIHVDGIDCEACAAPMRKALAKVGGFRDLSIDLAKQSVFVSFEPAPGRLEAYVAAINALGYDAALPATPEARR